MGENSTTKGQDAAEPLRRHTTRYKHSDGELGFAGAQSHCTSISRFFSASVFQLPRIAVFLIRAAVQTRKSKGPR